MLAGLAILAGCTSDAPSSPETGAERAAVVWDWANALALHGIPMPPDLPLTIAFLRWAEVDGGEPFLPPGVNMPRELQLRRLDRYIEELHRLEQGRRPGTLRFGSNAALVSRTWTTIEQVFTVEDGAFTTGATFVLGKAGSNEARVQHEDPAAPNYVTARASRAEVVLERTTAPWNGVHSNMMTVQPLPAFRVVAGTLEPGDAVTFTVGDRAQGSPGLRVPTFSNDRFMLPVYVDVDGSGDVFGLDWPSLVIVGSPEVTAVRVLAPSVVAAGESFTITVRSEDDAMNRASGEIPAYEVLLGDAVVARLEAGGDAVATLDGLRIEEPGIHRFRARSSDGRLSAVSNPVWVQATPENRILWGDTHGHTDFAEGQGSPEAYFSYARDDARLDFVTLSEHDLWMDDGEWRTLQRLVREVTVPGRFVGILGYEWTAFPDRGGHHNVFLRDPESARVGLQEATRLPDLYRELRARYRPDQVLVIPHAHIPGDWRRSDAELERMVELYSVHGSFESFANAYLRNGFELGFVAAGDTHLAKPGLAPAPLTNVSQAGGLVAVLAAETTTDAIFSALRDRRAYATSGQRIVLDTELNGFPMGTRQPAAPRRRVRGRVHGTAPIDRIDVVRGGSVILSRSYLAAPLASHAFLQVAFESSTEVKDDVHDSPRGSRPWRGTLDVEGARIAAVHLTAIDSPLRETVKLDPDRAESVRFSILTRGRADSFLLELQGAGPQTELRFRLEPAREVGATYPLRPPADLSAADVVLRLEDLERGRLEQVLPGGDGQTDRIALQVVDPAGALDRTFEYDDLESAPGDGVDYYYLRVTQLDGGRAWSSPWWVEAEGEP